MEKSDIIKIAVDFMHNTKDNVISEEIALSDQVVGMKIYEDPIFAFGAADDELFERLKDPAVIGDHFMTPKEWLPSAKTVISFFLPFTDAVKRGNARDMLWPSDEWLHARVEGQALIVKLLEHLNTQLTNAGYRSLAPCLDKRFWSKTERDINKQESDSLKENELLFTSNWSERHVAFVSGLGTFGLSKGLITKKGIAGRFGSIITDLALPPDQRDYQDIYQYCSQCGKCAEHCPVNAISLKKGKDHFPCAEFISKTKESCAPRYGCGKCQVDVPCTNGIPD